MKVAVLGATSQIARDLIYSFANNTDYDCVLFSRDSTRLSNLIAANTAMAYQKLDYSNFSVDQHYDLIINFVGIGDPALAKAMGSKIFDITLHYDMMVLNYLEHHPSCKYIFLSSGAVYGNSFDQPVNSDTQATININHLKATDWYVIAKIYAEARHRASSEFDIVDIRVFNYFSHTQNLESKFLITDIIRSIKNNEIFITSSENIFRDFITPPDFFNLVQCIINSNPKNLALDCYTQAPIDKLSLLNELSIRFGLKYKIHENNNIMNATGIKVSYYSLNKSAQAIGYNPLNNSLNGLIAEFQNLKLHNNA
jgi:nucleoside-diphosphate-sugar epimerase